MRVDLSLLIESVVAKCRSFIVRSIFCVCGFLLLSLIVGRCCGLYCAR